MRLILAFTAILIIGGATRGSAAIAEPWYIDAQVTVTEPMEVGDVIVLSDGALLVQDVPEPGFRVSGNLIVTGDGRAEFKDSVIRILSTYHGEYFLVAMGQGFIGIRGCDYRIPNGVQHALIAWENSLVDVADSDFGFAQFLVSTEATLTASRLNGSFECLVQESGQMLLRDIPRDEGAGGLWVWPTFMPGSSAVYSPPLPGFVLNYEFPPPDAGGIDQSFSITHCNVVLWPMLVREESELTLLNIAPENWVVVGLHFPSSTTISDLINNQTYDDTALALEDRLLHLQNASIDTWNLYPEADVQFEVYDSLVGEILASGNASVMMQNTTVDGSGGYFGVSSQAVLEAIDCTFTCDIQVAEEGFATFRKCSVLPYPTDTDGSFTRFGAYDEGRLHLDQTVATSNPSLGGQGAIAVTYLIDTPTSPPSPGNPVQVHGYAGIYSLDPAGALSSWTFTAHRDTTTTRQLLGKGKTNVEGGVLGKWSAAKVGVQSELVLILKDNSDHLYTSRTLVPVP